MTPVLSQSTEAVFLGKHTGNHIIFISVYVFETKFNHLVQVDLELHPPTSASQLLGLLA